ncbi:MAG TPA: hypothetical protein VH415_02670 [Nitrososphaeraceae archaeon]|jgi:hypothetical protein
MEIIEIIGWLVLGFVPMFVCLHVLDRELSWEKMTKRKMSSASKEVIEGGL